MSFNNQSILKWPHFCDLVSFEKTQARSKLISSHFSMMKLTENGNATLVEPLSIPRTVRQCGSTITGNSVPPCSPKLQKCFPEKNISSVQQT